MEKLKKLFPEIYKKSIEEAYRSGYFTELFLRIGQPAIFFIQGQEYLLLKNGTLFCATKDERDVISQCYLVTKSDLYEILQQATQATPVAYREEIGQGYLTLDGGHRLGFAGHIAENDRNNKVNFFKHINGMMLRIAKEHKGCATNTIPFLIEGNRLLNTLVIAPPGCGKTTFLRDCARAFSDGFAGFPGKKTVVVDERMELAAVSNGSPQFDVGRRTNVISGCKKDVAFVMAVRSLSPEILIADEIGFEEESRALLYGIYSGCSVLCSTHGSSVEEVQDRNSLKELFREGIFGRFVILRKKQQHYSVFVYDTGGKLLNG